MVENNTSLLDVKQLLTINVTPGVQFGPNQPGTTISNTGNLTVGQNLTLAAGNLDLQGQLYAGGNLTLQAQDTVRVRDSVANPFIAAAEGQLLVQGDRVVDIFALNHPNSGLFSGGDMVLRSANPVGGDIHYWSGGNFRIEQLNGSGGSLVSTDEMSGIQALERLHPALPMRPRRVERIEFEYIRHGTQTLLANWHVAKGQLIHPTIGATRTEEDFKNHIARTLDTDPEAGWIFIVDQLNS
ncbi:MAG TPA: hypothetical protein V6D26_26080 [Stenomitos sp.]